jgi:ubiquinone/menaquinone biosynthesis C-methylase UbiE
MIERFLRFLRARSRRSRYEFFWKTVEPADTGLILDLGGGSGPCPPARRGHKGGVIIADIEINPLRRAGAAFPEALLIVADGMHMPFADQSIGCVFCNSVIEHTDQPELLAQEIARIGRSYFVQTPHRGFPFETHSFAPIPLYHSFSTPVQRLLCKVFRASYDEIASVRYLSESQLREMFPDSTLYKETFLGLAKSFCLARPAQVDE